MSNGETEIVIHSNNIDQTIIQIDNKIVSAAAVDGHLKINHTFQQKSNLKVFIGEKLVDSKEIKPIPAWMSLLPPLIAILLALIFREVVISLFLGVYIGTLIPAIYVDGIQGIFTSIFPIIDTYILNAMNNADHLSVILFSMIIGATVSVISKNGGMNGVVNYLSQFAKSRKSGQFITWLLGVLIFFDDYANTLVVGNTMRPVTDRLKISREKLSYLVDSTAAPIAAIAFVTTWIGAELGYIQDGVKDITALNESAYSIFLQSLQYSFYPILTLLFMLILIFTGRDFGPMFHAEKLSYEDHSLNTAINVDEMKDFQPDEGTPSRSFNAVIPVLVIVFGTVISLIVTGFDIIIWSDQNLSTIQKLSATIGQADPYKSLLWSSLLGLIVASGLTLTQRLLSVSQTMGSIMNGFKTMLTAMVILILAWSLSAVTDDMQTAGFLSGAISQGMTPFLFPAITFIISGFVAFATGSSWGSMAILYPLMLTLSWSVCEQYGMSVEETMPIFLNVVSCVLAGSVLGDHCSPISDTTILSSLASSCNHIDHVRTQLPYALTVGIVSILFGTIPAAFGVPSYICFAVSLVVLWVIVKKIGKPI